MAGRFKVDPPEVRVKAGGEFEVINATGYTVLVALPEEVLPDDSERPKRKKRIEESLAADPADFLARAVQIEPNGSTTFNIPPLAGARYRPEIEYSYEVAVFPVGGTEPAEGNSPPKIIIEP
jgi:hypothetical protein